MAFDELVTERPTQDGSLCPIPVSAIKRYCREEELDPLETEALIDVIRAVDGHQRKLAKERQAREHEKNKTKVRR